MTAPSSPAMAARPGRERLLLQLIPGLAALLIVAFFALAFLMLAQSREARLSQAERAAQSLALALEEQTGRQLQAAGMTLSSLGDLWSRLPALREPGSPQMSWLMRQKMAALPFVSGIAIVDEGGRLAQHSDLAPPAVRDYADSDFFSWHRSRAGGIYVGKPLPGERSFVVSRRLADGDGRFAGVIVARVEADALQKAMLGLDAGAGGSLELLHGDGELIARVPDAPTWLGLPLGGRVLLKDLQAQPGSPVFRSSSPIDGVARIHSARPVGGVPLMVQAGIGEDETLAAWRQERTAATVLLLLFTLAAILLAWLLVRELQRRYAAGALVPAENLRESEERYRSLFEHSIDAVLVMRPDGAILEANGAAVRLLGYSEEELRVGGRDSIFDAADARLPVLAAELLRSGVARGEFRLRRKDGSPVPVEVSAAAFHNRAGESCATLAIRDVTERRRAEEHIEYLAYHDELTGIPNRAHFQRAFDHAVAITRQHGLNCALMLVDLDRFKNINDTIGHQAGDQLLKQMAARLRACLRDSDIIARLGGDEFVILMQDASAMEAVGAVAEKILEVASRPLIIDDQEFLVTASIGISTYPKDGEDLQTLLKNSDLAMYRAKAAGKNGFQYFSPEMNLHTRERLQTESSLRGALDRGEFTLHFQPKVRMASLEVAGMEALIRWRNPERGLLGPGEFIAIAEETGMIVPIGDWAIEEACRQAQAMRKSGHDNLKVAVNLSARQLYDEGLPRRVADILEHTGFPARNLELEITESMVMQDAERAVRLLSALHGTGVRIAIDDFGTGYSSLSYLKRFPIDCVKIDRSFIRDLPDNRDDVSITRSIIAMAHNMKLEVVAEGVETSRQYEFLNAHGCDEIQGFLFSRPLGPEALEHFLGRQVAEARAGALHS